MAQRWTFEEDYIVCRFSFKYLFGNVSRKELDLLILELKESGFTERSIGAINRRVRDYQEIFIGRPDYLATEQVKAIATAYMHRMENPGRLKELQLCIDKMLQQNEDECWFENAQMDETMRSMQEYIISGGTYGNRANGVAIRQSKSGGKLKYIFERLFLP